MIEESKIEKRWTTAVGYEAEVLATSMGHRCGYVTVPEGHSCAGKDYNDLDVDVHGGLTYALDNQFGFDCAHFYDAKDPELMSEEYRKIYERWPSMRELDGTVKTLEFCVKQCEKLAAQLKELE
jgi:hypothetical protein